MNLFTVAARNVLRNQFRTALTVLGAAVAVLAFVALRTVISAWSVGVDYAAKDRLGTRNKVTFIVPLPKKYVEIVRAVPGVKQACFMNWFGGKNPKNDKDFFASSAVDDNFLDVFNEFLVEPAQKQAYLADKRGALVGDVLARSLGVKVGDTVTLAGSIYPGDWQFTVDGIYRPGTKAADRSQFLFHWDYLNDSLPEAQRDHVGWIMARIDDPSRGPAISAAIDKIFDDKDVQTATMSEKSMMLSFMGMLSAVLAAVDIVSVLILGIMMMILGNTIAMGVRERTREYGVLRAVGFEPKHIAIFVIGEAFTVGVLSGLVGLALAYPVVEMGLGRFLEENVGSFFPYFRIEPRTAVTAVLLAIGLSTTASILPAYRASKLEVTEALRRVA